jgi:hypothetical protein
VVPLPSLWLPIVVAAVLVFVVSAILHMVLRYHRADFRALPDEARRLDALRGVPPGRYAFPHCDEMKEMKSPAMLDKYRTGPVGILTLMPNGVVNMGKALGLWFVYGLAVSLFAGYLASRTLAPGSDYLAVFRIAGASSFMAYSLAPFVDSIWHGVPWSNTLRAMLDGLLYALATGGAFGWLWPR